MHDRRLRLFGIPVLSLLITLLTISGHGTWTVSLFLIDWGISFYFTFFLWIGNRALWSWVLRWFPRVEQTAPRLWVLAILSVVYTSVATVLLRLPLHMVLPTYFTTFWPDHFKASVFNLIPTLVVQTIYEATYFFRQWEQNVRRTEQLTRAGVQSQLEALQSQLDPHFLFNSLNTLSALIDEQNMPAQEFVEQLADVYRYVLVSREKPTVPLAEELAFVDTYLALQKARFRDNLQVEQHVPPDALTQHVAPLSVQLLVENALKHNVVSRKYPLHLAIRYEPQGPYLVVENMLRPRSAGLAPSTGMGLRNVCHRYELLQAPQPVTVATDDGWFRVQLPLLANTLGS
jgi:sensor histidine kinase YesM